MRAKPVPPPVVRGRATVGPAADYWAERWRRYVAELAEWELELHREIGRRGLMPGDLPPFEYERLPRDR